MDGVPGGRGDPVVEHRVAAETVAAVEATVEEILHSLASLGNVRRDVDRIERDLIAAAREKEVAWPDIAAALGLGSRQAAEQRWLRLTADSTRDPNAVRRSRRTQRIVDTRSGPEAAALRRAATEAGRRIAADHGWDDRHNRAALARTSLVAAVGAEPGALYALCCNAMDDLDAMAAVRLPPMLAGAVRRLRQALADVRRHSTNG